MEIEFAASKQSTLGVEWEVALVDRQTGDMRSVANEVLSGVHALHGGLSEDEDHPHVKQELLLNTVEVVTGVCDSVAQAEAELSHNLNEIRRVTDPMGVDLYSAGSHPFSPPKLQPVTDKERYAKMIDRTQWWGQQMAIYGVHVHVGVDRREKALPIVDGLVNYQPHFQALSASSPFWGGEDTGYASQRALMFQQLPTAGLPYHFGAWEAFEHYVGDMLHTGVIDDISEIRWDVRPVPKFGTVEMRICDGMSSLQDISAIAALTQCLVHEMSTGLDNGWAIPVMPPWLRVENKWRAARYGLDSIIILDQQGNEALVTDEMYKILNRLEPVARELGCSDELADIERILRGGAGYQWQRQIAAANDGDLRAVVADNVARMRVA